MTYLYSRKYIAEYLIGLVLDVRHKGHVAGSLDRDGQSSLMLRAVAGDAARKDLASLGDKLLQLRSILVIDLIVLFAAEHAYLLASVHRSAAASRSFTLIKRHLNPPYRRLRGSVKRKFLINPLRDVDKSAISRLRYRSGRRLRRSGL